MSWTIRKAGGLDLGSLTRLVHGCIGEGWSRSALADSIEGPSTLVRLALRDEGEPPLGFVVARCIDDFVEIDLLGVAPEARRLGGAAAMLEDLKSVAVGLGARELRLELRASNAAAESLYRGGGFVVVGTRSRYYPDGEDARLLTCHLPPRA